MYKRILISIFAMFFLFCAQAQDKKYVYQDTALLNENKTTEKIEEIQAPAEDNAISSYSSTVDTSLYLNHNFFPADSIAAWRKDKGLLYLQNLDSLLKANKNSKEKPVTIYNVDTKNYKAKELPKEDNSTPVTYDQPSSSSEPGWFGNLLASQGAKIFFWILAAGFILFILYKLFLTKGAFKREATKNTSGEPEVSEEIITHESDFDRMIRLAVEGGNYRSAVRYQYLKTLHGLAEKQHVSMAADKTNYQYVQEIANTNLRNDFAALTLNYEYIWYGEFVINDILYRRLATSFSDLNKKI